jgi:chorismate mutase
LDLDFDGLMIESHNFPIRALSDADQQVTPEELDSMMKRLKVRYQNQNLDSPLESKEQRLLELRQSIDQLDNQLLEILMMRKKIVEKIGKIKQEHNMTIFQMDRFQKMIQDRCEKGRGFDLSEDYVAALFAHIHEESVKQQNLLS